jgi:hypothetical protein
MNDHDAYAAFLASEQLKRHMEASKEIIPALFTLSWFISNKPTSPFKSSSLHATPHSARIVSKLRGWGEMGCRCTRRACLLEKRLKQDLPLLGLPLLHRLVQCLSLTASSTSIAAGTRAVPASIAWTGSAETATPL